MHVTFCRRHCGRSLLSLTILISNFHPTLTASEVIPLIARAIPQRDVKLTCPTMETRLGWSLTRCAQRCAASGTCVAFNWGKSACEMLTSYLCAAGSCSLTSAPGFRYYDLDAESDVVVTSMSSAQCQTNGYCSPKCTITTTAATTTTTTTPTTTPAPVYVVGKPCSSAATCQALVTLTTCLNSVCACTTGVAHRNTSSGDNCVTDCTAYSGYGSTFHLRSGYGFTTQASAQDNFYNGVSLTQCQSNCLGQTAYVCRSMAYDVVTSTCHNSPVTCYDVPAKCGANTDRRYYTRNCA